MEQNEALALPLWASLSFSDLIFMAEALGAVEMEGFGAFFVLCLCWCFSAYSRVKWIWFWLGLFFFGGK